MALSRRSRIGLGIAAAVAVLGVAGAGTALAVAADSAGAAITGPAADTARSAAVAAVPGGKAGAVSTESDNGAAYAVAVTRPDGSTVDVLLDAQDAVVGTRRAGTDGADGADTDAG